MTRFHLILFLIFHDAVALPPLSCVHRFAHCTPHIVNICLEQNCQYRHNLAREHSLYPHLESYTVVMHEANVCYQAWDCLRDARQTFYVEEEKRRALWRLRNIIGDERFEAGDMIAHLPFWRFEVLR